jgi:hypothetical protein
MYLVFKCNGNLLLFPSLMRASTHAAFFRSKCITTTGSAGICLTVQADTDSIWCTFTAVHDQHTCAFLLPPCSTCASGGRYVAKMFTDEEVTAAALAAAGGNIPAATAITPLHQHHHHTSTKGSSSSTAAADTSSRSTTAASGTTGSPSSTTGGSQALRGSSGFSTTGGTGGGAQGKVTHSGSVAHVQAEAAAVNAAFGLTADKVHQQQHHQQGARGTRSSTTGSSGASSSPSAAGGSSGKERQGALTEQQLKTCARPSDVAACRAEVGLGWALLLGS